MTTRRSFFWIKSFLLGALVLAAACNRPAKPVAKVGKEWVGQAQWQAYLAEAPVGMSSQAALDRLVRREVAWEQARKSGLLQDEAWLAVAPQLRRTVLVRAYLDGRPGQSTAPEEMIRRSFLTDNEERHVLHVLCATREAAAVARQRLVRGEAFGKVADAMSKDPSAIENHGDLGWIKRQSVVKEFGKAVFEAQAGELCGPLQSKFGWHVALVKEVRGPKVEDYERMKAQLRDEAHDQVNALKRPQALQTLKGKYPLSTDPVILNLDQSLTPAPGDAKRIAGKIGGVEVSLAELKVFMQEAIAGGAMQHSLSAAVKTRYLDILGDDIRLAIAAEKEGLAKRPEVQAALWMAERKALFNGFSRTYLRKLQLTDQTLVKHLAEHPDRFKGVGAVRVYFLVAKSPEAAGKAIAEAQKGTAWDKLVAGFADKEVTGNWNPGFLDVAALNKVLPPEAAKALLAAPLNAVIGPISAPDGPMLFRVLERRPGGVLPLEQCKDEVKEDYLRTHGEELVGQYLESEGRKDIPIQIFLGNAGPLTGK